MFSFINEKCKITLNKSFNMIIIVFVYRSGMIREQDKRKIRTEEVHYKVKKKEVKRTGKIHIKVVIKVLRYTLRKIIRW